jgi:transposase
LCSNCSRTADEPWIWALFELAPTPAKAAKLTLELIEKLLCQCKIRRIETAQVAAALRGPIFSLSEGTVEAASDHALMLLPHLRLLHQQRLAVAARTERLLAELSITQESQSSSDMQVLLSLPGVGRIVTAKLLAEASQVIAERDYHALRAHAGVAPFSRQSGKRTPVPMRYGCNVRLRNAL